MSGFEKCEVCGGKYHYDADEIIHENLFGEDHFYCAPCHARLFYGPARDVYFESLKSRAAIKYTPVINESAGELNH
jgi:hypothetical protein